jgi:hypothetical protein
MNPERMLDLCKKGQWKIDDLDWSGTPRPMSREEEISIVQYFTDMAGIERFAGALFDEQRRRVDDPTMKKIFSTFVADEERHAKVAERLAQYYDVHHYRAYAPSPSLMAFRTHFLDAVRYLSAEIANAYITGGELILDVALLRSINDYVADDMSERVMALVNRDESRHIAVDYYMTEYYASPAYQAWIRAQPAPSIRERLKATVAFAGLLRTARPFFDDVFFEPMRKADPSGIRLREAMKRVQLLGTKPDVAARPFTRFMNSLRLVAEHPKLGPVFGKAAATLAGVPVELMQSLFTEEEAARARNMTFDELADDALAAKTLN